MTDCKFNLEREREMVRQSRTISLSLFFVVFVQCSSERSEESLLNDIAPSGRICLPAGKQGWGIP
jgi:hypothetical protein